MSTDSRDGHIWKGGLLFGGGLLVTVVSFATAAPGGTYLVATGAIIGGLIRLVQGLSMPRDNCYGLDGIEEFATRGPAPRDDPRPQVAGALCAHCELKITSELDGDVCAACNKPLHTPCRKDHRRDVHAKVARTAYR